MRAPPRIGREVGGAAGDLIVVAIFGIGVVEVRAVVVQAGGAVTPRLMNGESVMSEIGRPNTCMLVLRENWAVAKNAVR